ncbi:MAG TPA: carbohydrate kinase [Bacillota bacterium]|nr:carbohydrate kinase [Bacillota bacterium]
MGKCISIGEVLVDFIPDAGNWKLKDVPIFRRQAGGAPANVAAAVARLGGRSVVLSKLGNDPFGDFLIDEMKKTGIDTSYIKHTDEASTGLAFVSLKPDGNRDFCFYRNPSADMLLSQDEIDLDIFEEGDILHFCSIDLVDFPVRKAHEKAIGIAKEKRLIVSFDPNIRLSLWENKEELREIVRRFIPLSDILKISEDELEFITGKKDITGALSSLFIGDVKVIVYTMGANGSAVYTKDRTFVHDGFVVDAIDTTGCGDAFIGAFLYMILSGSLTKESLGKSDYQKILEFSNAVGSLVATKKGALASMPGYMETEMFLKEKKAK